MAVDISILYHKEIPDALALAKDMHTETPTYRGVEFNARKVYELLESACDPYAEHTCHVARIDGRIVGGYIAVAHTHFFTNTRYVAELALFLAREHRSSGIASLLVEDLQVWARDKGAAYVSVGVSTGIANNKIAGLYRKLGFKDNAISLMKELEDV